MLLTNKNYEYLNEEKINDELKCIICTEPFVKPVNLNCKHIFCQNCIDTWMNKNKSCPICRHQFESGYTYSMEMNSTLNDQLDALLIQCLRCKKSNIRRGHFKKHLARCSKSRVKRASVLLSNRWRSMKKMIQEKYRPHTTIPQTDDFVHASREQRDTRFRQQSQQFADLSSRVPHEPTLSRMTVVRSYEPLFNSSTQENVGWNIKTILYLSFIILAIWILVWLDQ